MKVKEFAEQAESLFVLPDSVTQLKKCLDDESSSIDDVGSIISTDPALAVQLLKVSNSALYRFPNKIETISKAVQVIGTRSAYELALAYGVSNAFKDVSGSVIDLDKFWEQSVSCGLLAKHIAERKKLRNPERFFVCGLLHNIGELSVVAQKPELAEKCAAFSSDIAPATLQLSVLGFHYTLLSAHIIKNWGIPKNIWKPISCVNKPVTTEMDLDGRILQLAYNLALDNINSDIYPAYTHIETELHEQMGFSNDDLEDALDITNMQCLSILSLFNPTAFMIY